jgi:hypothetical protein
MIGIVVLVCVVSFSIFIFQKKKIRSLELTVLDSRTGLPVSNVSVYYAVRTYVYYGKIYAILPLPSVRRLRITKEMKTDVSGKIFLDKIEFIGLKNEKILQEDLIVNFDVDGADKVDDRIDLLLRRLEGFTHNDQLVYLKQFENKNACWIINASYDFGDVSNFSQTAVKGMVQVIRNSKSLLKDKEEIVIGI